MRSKLTRISRASCVGAALALMFLASQAWTQSPDPTAAALGQYCTGCHNARLKTAGVVIEPEQAARAGENAELWERVVHQLRGQSMPPPNLPRPDAATYAKMAATLEAVLDRAAAERPRAGDLPALHRLTRTEYANAIRDLLALDQLPKEMDYTLLLPADNASSGFDNLADLLFVSPAIMERYLDAARKVSRLAVGDPQIPLMVNIHRTPLEQPQTGRVEELPPGTRGGLAIQSYFPLDGEYVFDIEMAGQARDAHELEISVDGERREVIAVGGGGGAGGRGKGKGRGRGAPAPEYRFAITAGPHLVGITFVQRTEALDEGIMRTRLRTRGSLPSIAAVTIRGPYNATGPGDTPSRRRIFTCRPASAAEEAPCAREILSTLVRRAYRRPAADEDLADLLPFYEAGRKERDFDLGIQRALERLLISPQFLYRIERDPPDAAPGTVHRISDLELASRLSFFIWSSIPDDELLEAAIANRLHEPAVLRAQTLRMLRDPRSISMVNNFAAQWLFLRDVAAKEPDLFLFRDFDDGLRKYMERETELFLDSILREDRPVTELITANYTFVNERLAKHYGIPNVRGADFRKVTFPPGDPRGGLLSQASVLTVTSYSTRTSPVLRGKYVLENLLASPPPPPPPDVPSLVTQKTTGEALTLRDAMQLHRQQGSVCAGCHARMDPIGFALENFDAVGRWRERDGQNPIDTRSTLPDGTVVDGVEGVKALLLKDPERFASAVAEKLLMYAAARNVQYYDKPAVRKIVREAAKDNYRFSALVLGVVESVPFQMREKKP
jgi:hypothetical protein